MNVILNKINALAEEVGESLGYEVDDLDILGRGAKTIVRVTIDMEGGVNLDDCAAFSRQFGALMDVDDPLKGRYTIEVSSPGLDRELRRPLHWQKSIGRLVRVVLFDPAPGESDVITGRIEAFSSDRITIAVDEEGNKEELGLDDIKRAKLEVEL